MTTPPDQPHQGLGDWSSATRTGQPGAPRNSDPSSSGTGRLLVAGMLIALLAGGAGGATGALIEHRMGQQDANSAADANRQVSAIARATLPSVVTIQIADSTGKPAGTGSGFVIRSQGHIVTNNHVARGAGPDGKLTVQFADNSQVDALLVGQQVIAVGAPFGLTGSVTTGIVSAPNRPVTTGQSMTDVSYLNAVQTDAAINPGKAAHPTIGVQVEAQLGPGARVTSAQDGGSAQQAGVQSGDVITAVDGVKVVGPTAFIVALRSKPIGATATLTITRDGQDRSVAVQTTASTN